MGGFCIENNFFPQERMLLHNGVRGILLPAAMLPDSYRAAPQGLYDSVPRF